MGTLTLNLLVGLVILVGLVGVVVPVLPGLLLIWAAVGVWAFVEDGDGRWVVLGLVTAVALAGQIVKYLIPGRRMRSAGVPVRTMVAGALVGVVGFFVIPVIGALLGFVAGVYLAERARLGPHAVAWPSTVEALKAGLLVIFIEFSAGAVCAGIWLVGAITVA